MIKFFLPPNPITPDPNDQAVWVKSKATLDLQDFVTLAIERGTSLTENDLSLSIR
jgi:hypothetical protein